jgi:flagellar biosynthesis protein FliR
MPGELQFPASLLFGFLLVLTRVGFTFLLVPVPGFRSAPEPAKVVLALVITFALFPQWPKVESPDLTTVVVWMAGEAALGIAFSLVILLFQEAFAIGAYTIGVQAGFSYASTIDPSSQSDSTVLPTIFQLMVGLLFFSTGLDHVLLRHFAYSLTSVPPGTFQLRSDMASVVLNGGTRMLETGIKLALPIAALLLLVDLALALLGRLNAQLQLLTLSQPIKLLGSLVALAGLCMLLPKIYMKGIPYLVQDLASVIR